MDNYRTSQISRLPATEPRRFNWDSAPPSTPGSRPTDEVAGAAAETVEVDEDIALAQVVEAGGEARAFRGGAGGVILEDPLTAGLVERVELEVEDLAAFDRSNPGVCAPVRVGCRQSLDLHERFRPPDPLQSPASALWSRKWQKSRDDVYPGTAPS